MLAMPGGVLCVQIVAQKIQRCDGEILDAHRTVLHLGQRQMPVVQRIDDNQHGQRWHGAQLQHRKAHVEIGECRGSCAHSAQQPKEHGRRSEHQERGPIEDADHAQRRHDRDVTQRVRRQRRLHLVQAHTIRGTRGGRILLGQIVRLHQHHVAVHHALRDDREQRRAQRHFDGVREGARTEDEQHPGAGQGGQSQIGAQTVAATDAQQRPIVDERHGDHYEPRPDEQRVAAQRIDVQIVTDVAGGQAQHVERHTDGDVGDGDAAQRCGRVELPGARVLEAEFVAGHRFERLEELVRVDVAGLRDEDEQDAQRAEDVVGAHVGRRRWGGRRAGVRVVVGVGHDEAGWALADYWRRSDGIPMASYCTI